MSGKNITEFVLCSLKLGVSSFIFIFIFLFVSCVVDHFVVVTVN